MTPPIVWKHLCNATRAGQEECIIRLGRANVPVRVDRYVPKPVTAYSTLKAALSESILDPIYSLYVSETDYYRAMSTLKKEGLL